MKPSELATATITKIESRYPFLKANKKREIIRLAFDIAKIKKDFSFSFLPDFSNYQSLKTQLVKLRYPIAFRKVPSNALYLPKLDLNEKNLAITYDEDIMPDTIFYETSAKYSDLLERLKKKFPLCKFDEIESLKKNRKDVSAATYSLRKRNWVVMRQKSAFVQECPCTKDCISCGYFNMNLGFGCPYECSYCYLQGYQNINAILLPFNIEDFFVEFDKKFSNIKRRIRIGSGEFSDSLALDEFTAYSSKLVDFFSEKENVIFEFKTKSANIDSIISLINSENIVVSFSLSPLEISNNEEFLCACLGERIEAMRRLAKKGFKTAFHLDPVVFSKDFKRMYTDLLDQIFSSVIAQSIAWVSLGSFRFARETFKTMEKRFPQSYLLTGELFLDFDGKLRYPFFIRQQMYSFIIDELKKRGLKKEKIYLCMESPYMWNKLSLSPSFNW